MSETNDSFRDDPVPPAVWDTGAGGQPGSGELLPGRGEGERDDPEFEALVAMAALARGNASFLPEALLRLGRKRRRNDPQGAARAFRRALIAVLAVAAARSNEAAKGTGHPAPQGTVDRFLVHNARKVWREAVALPLPHRPDDLYGTLSAIDAVSRPASGIGLRSLPAQAYALGYAEDECLRLFWEGLAGQPTVSLPTGPMSLCWSLVQMGAALAGAGAPQAPVFLYRSLLWNTDERAEARLNLAEAARAVAGLPQGQREPLLLMILHEVQRKTDSVRDVIARFEKESSDGRGAYPSAARDAAVLRSAEMAAADLNWIAPFLMQGGVDEGLREARRLYGRDAAPDELAAEISGRSPWLLSQSRACRAALGASRMGDPALIGTNHLQFIETRTNYMAWLYREVTRPATAERVVSAWLDADGPGRVASDGKGG